MGPLDTRRQSLIAATDTHPTTCRIALVRCFLRSILCDASESSISTNPFKTIRVRRERRDEKVQQIERWDFHTVRGTCQAPRTLLCRSSAARRMSLSTSPKHADIHRCCVDRFDLVQPCRSNQWQGSSTIVSGSRTMCLTTSGCGPDTVVMTLAREWLANACPRYRTGDLPMSPGRDWDVGYNQ